MHEVDFDGEVLQLFRNSGELFSVRFAFDICDLGGDASDEGENSIDRFEKFPHYLGKTSTFKSLESVGVRNTRTTGQETPLTLGLLRYRPFAPRLVSLTRWYVIPTNRLFDIEPCRGFPLSVEIVYVPCQRRVDYSTTKDP